MTNIYKATKCRNYDEKQVLARVDGLPVVESYSRIYLHDLDGVQIGELVYGMEGLAKNHGGDPVGWARGKIQKRRASYLRQIARHREEITKLEDRLAALGPEDASVVGSLSGQGAARHSKRRGSAE